MYHDEEKSKTFESNQISGQKKLLFNGTLNLKAIENSDIVI
jgi:hypothetical protein